MTTAADELVAAALCSNASMENPCRSSFHLRSDSLGDAGFETIHGNVESVRKQLQIVRAAFAPSVACRSHISLLDTLSLIRAGSTTGGQPALVLPPQGGFCALEHGRSEGGCYEDDTVHEGTNHSVLIVGWDDEACGGDGAWIIKNSFGEGWGEEGFATDRYEHANLGRDTHVVYWDSGQEIELIETVVDDAETGDGELTGTQPVWRGR